MKKTGRLLMMALLTEAVVLLDVLAVRIGKRFFQEITMQYVVTFLLVFLFWGVGIWLVLRVFRAQKEIAFRHEEKPGRLGWLVAAGCLAASMAIYWWSWGGLKIYTELTGSVRLLGLGLGGAFFVAQHLYYFLEAVLMVMLMAFVQEMGSTIFRWKEFPYGGVGLALLWGLPHILHHGFADGMTSTVMALVFGCGFVAVRKNWRYAIPLTFLMFVI